VIQTYLTKYQILAGPVAVQCGETAAKIDKIVFPDCTGLHEVEGARISGQSVYKGGKVVKPYISAAFTPPGDNPGTHFS
jgi:hypothetical protein